MKTATTINDHRECRTCRAVKPLTTFRHRLTTQGGAMRVLSARMRYGLRRRTLRWRYHRGRHVGPFRSAWTCPTVKTTTALLFPQEC